MTLEHIVEETKAFYCLECGKCSGLCPISRYNPAYSPRVMVQNALLGLQEDLVHDRELFSCLTCYACRLKCPSDVDYPLFTQRLRAVASTNGEHGDCAHSGVLQSLVRLMSSSSVEQRRLDWVPETRHVSQQSDVLFFVGCAPYFDPLFEDIGVRTLDTAKASLEVLNLMGIEPLLLPNEKCCGHDMLWTGDTETFGRLAEQNAAAIREAGVKKIIFSCAECYRTFKVDYPQYVSLDCELQHISEALAQEVEKGGLQFREVRKRVTFQDPCRLGRHLGVYEDPRKVIRAIPGIDFVELERNREESLCCGTSAFTNCSAYSKQIRVDRLLEARATGAGTLITSCPKCQIHFKCAMISRGQEKGPDIEIDTMDLMSLVADALRGQDRNE